MRRRKRAFVGGVRECLTANGIASGHAGVVQRRTNTPNYRPADLPESVDNKILSLPRLLISSVFKLSSTIAIMATAKNQQTCYPRGIGRRRGNRGDGSASRTCLRCCARVRARGALRSPFNPAPRYHAHERALPLTFVHSFVDTNSGSGLSCSRGVIAVKRKL
jgi:hypothetical protein